MHFAPRARSFALAVMLRWPRGGHPWAIASIVRSALLGVPASGADLLLSSPGDRQNTVPRHRGVMTNVPPGKPATLTNARV